MQQFITSSEACALLDRILQTSQSLNRAINEYVRNDPFAKPPEPIQAAILPEPVVLPTPERAVAPVLTIKLSDLMRVTDESRRRRTQRPSRPQPEKAHSAPSPTSRPKEPSRRPMRSTRAPEVEVIYRRSPSFRMVS
jgi:hypothetical protein